ncbi:MAG: hypothetical protein LIO85_07135 [Rikenellaceae bacterium]|nr:hypothetical protein [Rikenellaceae bacterium]
MKKVYTVIAISFLAVCLIPVFFLSACSKNDEVSLSFSDPVYTVEAGSNKEIDIESGNGNYSIYTEDESVVLAGYSKTGKKSSGKLILTGLNAGETSVSVVDNITNEEVRLRVIITEP